MRKPVVGLAGGVGSGKSEVARILAELGAGIIDSDALAHEEINNRDVKVTLTRWWGPGIIAPDGSVDRKRVSTIVFGDASQRHRLEALLHPRIAVRRADQMAELERQPRVRLIVIDSPLLYETDLDLMCDAVIFVEADLETRARRSEKTRRWSRDELLRREKSQQPLDMKRARADYICENNSDLAALRKTIEGIVVQILQTAGAA